MKRALVLFAVAAMLVLPASADDSWVKLTPNSYTGGFHATAGGSPSLTGTSLAYLGGPLDQVGMKGGRIGAEFAGPTTIASFTIAQNGSGGAGDTFLRKTVAEFDVWADGVYIETISVPKQYAQQTVYLSQPIEATWVTLVLKSQYDATSSSYNMNTGLTNFWFNGTAYVPSANPEDAAQWVNYNSKLQTVTTAGQTAGAATLTTNGNLACNNSGQAVYWNPLSSNGTNQSLTVTYADGPKDVGVVGIALMGDYSDTFARCAPKSVTIIGETFVDGAWKQSYIAEVDIDPILWHYCRYDLTKYGNKEVFEGIGRLTIMFPDSSASNWNGSTSNFYGLVEFQAFAPIPEPATMSLLALGGLALLRRRRK